MLPTARLESYLLTLYLRVTGLLAGSAAHAMGRGWPTTSEFNKYRRLPLEMREVHFLF